MVAPTSVWIVVVVVVAAGVAGLGFYAGYDYRGSPASSPSSVTNSTLSVLGAGTLNTVFPQVASALANETPGISAPAASQTYEGSLDVTTAISALSAKVDVAAVADFRLIPDLLQPTYASYEVVFASTPEVLVYNPSIAAFDGINSSNWGTKLFSAVSTSGVAPFAVWNASTDPNGYNEIFSMMLEGMIYHGGDRSAVYSHFYSGAPGAFAVPIPSVTKLEKEGQAASLLSTGVVSSLITYRAYAALNHLTYVTLDPIVGLEANNSTALADYAKLSTTVLSSSGGTEDVSPAPVLFAVTVPTNAPNSALGAAFLHLLLSPQGEALLARDGAFTPVFPGWADTPSAVPSVLAPDVAPMPAWAASYLA
jgi:molybdate/tungstate transport system substrate-binding protein